MASAAMSAYRRLGARAAAAESPSSATAAPDIQYVSGGFSRNGVPASSGRACWLCTLMRQAMSASRGSSGVHSARSNMPSSHSGASASAMNSAGARGEADERGGDVNDPPKGSSLPGRHYA